jgi:hypothetical protein
MSYRCLRSVEVGTGFALVMTIGNLGALIFGHAEDGDYAVGIPETFEQALIRLAPVTDVEVWWPPQVVLDAAGRDALGDSFLMGPAGAIPAGARPA